MSRPDYAALGFTVSAADAVEVLGLTSIHELYDHLRIGVLIALYDFRDGHTTPTFHPAELADLKARIVEEKLTVEQRIAIKTQSILRQYLEANEAVGDYDEAIETGVPVLAGALDGGVDTYIRAETVTDWFNERRDLSQQATITKSSVTNMLERIGAAQRRGFVPLAERGTGAQRWTRWWRLPRSFVEGTAPEFSRFRRGEKITHRHGLTTLTPPLGGSE